MAAYFCPHCKAKVTFRDLGPKQPPARWRNRTHHIWMCNNCGGAVYASVGAESRDVMIYPSLRSDAPEEYPDDVRDDFSEAIRSLNAGNPKAAVMTTRSALQSATRQLGANGKNLKEEIDDLAKNHVIPSSLADWAHDIRDGGNLAAHPEPDRKVMMADAEELIALAESVFEYLYVIPKNVERRRERLAESQQQEGQIARAE